MALEFEGPLCLRQLKYAGLFEAIRIRKSGYFFRLPNTLFFRTNYLITSGNRPKVRLSNHML